MKNILVIIDVKMYKTTYLSVKCLQQLNKGFNFTMILESTRVPQDCTHVQITLQCQWE